jgi:hypothetical protein
MFDDNYWEKVIADGTVRPLKGHLTCEKYHKSVVEHVEGIGDIPITGVTEGGLVLVGEDDSEAEDVKAFMLRVRVVGEDPEAWKFRFFGKERDYKSTFAEQRVRPGVIIAVRGVAGANQSKNSHIIDVRYDEIVAIGTPKGEFPAMLPAPGWVLVEHLDPAPKSRLHISAGAEQITQEGNVRWGRIIALPRGTSSDGLEVGNEVCFPSHGGVGATEQLQFEDGRLRALPLDDVYGTR